MTLSLSSSYADLKNSLQRFLDQPIQTFKKKEPSILDIAGFPNHENVFSNLYKFFLSEHDNGIGRLFFTALQECIDGKNIQMTSWIVEREVVTEKGNRIDLVIRENGENPNNVIIIENKVHHTLLNDLDDYLNHYQAATNRIGIVLSLNLISGIGADFVNITHKQWIQSVKSHMGEFITQMDLKHFTLLQDFIMHIDSYYEKPVTMESLQFLFDNAKKIALLDELRTKATEQLKKDLTTHIPQSWENCRVTDKNVSLTRENEGLVLYVTLDNLFKGEDSYFLVELWLKGERRVAKWKSLPSIPESKVSIKLQKGNGAKEWVLIASKEYPVKVESLDNFHKAVNNELSGEWEVLIREVNNLIGQ